MNTQLTEAEEMEELLKELNEEYRNLEKRSDFEKLFAKAIREKSCMLCHGTNVIENYGLDLECAQFIDKKLLNKIESKYHVDVKVTVTPRQ